MAVMAKEKHQIEKPVKRSWERNPTWVNYNTEKKTVMFNSSSTLLSFFIGRAYISKTNLHIILIKPKT